MGMATDQDDRSQTGRKAMVGQGCRDADGGAGGRTERGSRARAQTPGAKARKRETTGGKTGQARVSAPGTRAKRADGRATGYRGGSDPWARGAPRTRGGRRVAQAD